jgi:hypothetical protein
MQLQNLNNAVVEEQAQPPKCIASHLNRCSDEIEVYDVDYYSYPNYIGHQERHIFQAHICKYHYDKIRGTMSEQLKRERILPHTWGHTEQDARDSILQGLHYESPDCVCNNYGNELHKALIAYTRGGFMIRDDYYCESCEHNHPSWRDGLEAFNAVLMSLHDIEQMIEKRSDMLLEENNEGKRPIQIIPELIDMLEESRDWEYVKYQEQGIAGVNAQSLRDIMEMIKQNGGGEEDDF